MGGYELDEVGEEEVAGDEEVEEDADLEVGGAEVVAVEADEDAILGFYVSECRGIVGENQGSRLPFECFQ